MAGTLDSEAYFKGRLTALKLIEFEPKFVEKNWTTVNSFAYSNSYVPGRADETALAEKVFKHVLGALDHAKESALRRLFTECHIMANADVQRKVLNPDEENKQPRKLPLEERGQRWEDIQAEFPLLSLEGQLEPSYALIDKYVEMEENNVLKFLKWEEFTMRDQEEKGVKKLELWAEREGQLVRYYKDIEIYHQAEDRMDLWFALQRRGLAMQMAKLLHFPVHQKLVDFYFAEMSAEPIDPERFDKIKLTQIFNADKMIFLMMGRATKKGFKHLGNISNKEYPLDKIFREARESPKVIQILLPEKIEGGARRPQQQEAASSKKRPAEEHVTNLMNKIKKLEAASSKGKGSGKDKSKGKGKGDKNKERTPPMPRDLIGMLNKVDGNKVCYAYNMKTGCKSTGVDGCTRGTHLCVYPKCEESDRRHSLQRCPAYAKSVMKSKGF